MRIGKEIIETDIPFHDRISSHSQKKFYYHHEKQKNSGQGYHGI